MTNPTTPKLTRAALAGALDVHGANRLRWPIELRAGAAALLVEDATARLLYREAAALDLALDHAPQVDAARTGALADRIRAVAERSPRIAASTSGAMLAAARPGRSPASGFGGGRWSGGAVLAASLVLGLLVGGTGLTHPAVAALEDLIGFSVGGGNGAVTLAQLGETLDEEHP